jgi:predicted O-methyltransferase YrrM
MKRMRLRAAIITLVLLGLAGLAVYSAEEAKEAKKMTDAEREQFIKDFHRTGLNTTPGDARMLRILVEGAKCQRGVEVGSATGFGAINMGIGFERNGGHLWTIDIDPQMAKTCREKVARMALEKTVTVIEGDALKVLGELEGEYDFVFLDALKSDYGKYLKLMLPKMKPGAIVVADNVVRSAGQMKDFLDRVQNNPDWDTVIIQASQEKNDGMSISYKIR